MTTLRHILLVEDDAILADTLVSLLQEESYKVTRVFDGEEAMERLRHDPPPDLILSDIRMPRMNGYELLQNVRAMPGLNDVPVIFLSAKAALADIRMGLTLGADDYIPKPFEPEDALKSIRFRIDRAIRLRNARLQQGRFLMRYLPHELRTPLNGVLGYGELMQETAEEGKGLTAEETKDYAQNLLISGHRLLALMNNFTLWLELDTRIYSGERPAQPDSAWWEEVSAGARKVAEQWGRTADLKIQLAPVSLPVDPELLSRVMALLVDNAAKFSLPGTPLLLQGAMDGRQYRLTIVDQGRGLTPEQLVQVDVFQQFNREKNEQQGLGLGLAICRNFAICVGATMVLEKNPDLSGLRVGFTFNVPG
jgi:CheY-like chemotaxis protein